MNRLLSLNKELKSYKTNGTYVKSKSMTNGVPATNGSSAKVSEITVDGDVFVLDILDFFFGKSPAEKELSEGLKSIAVRALWLATKLSKTEKHMPPAPEGKPSISWLVSPEVQKVFRKFQGKGIYEAVKPAVGAKLKGSFESALLDVKTAEQQALTQQMAASNTALVVFIENTGALPFTWPSSVPQVVRDGLVKVIDYISEEFEKWLNKFADAKGKKYKEVIILEDAKATYQNLKSTLHDLARKEFIIDVFTLAHGNRSSFASYNGADITNTDIRAIRDSYGSPLPIRVVYMMNCEASGLNDDWLYTGARAVAGALNTNYIPEPMMTKFWNNWLRGDNFTTAVSTAYNDSVKLISDTISKASYIPFFGGDIVKALSAHIGPMLADSKPKIEGNGAITIATASLAAAHSLSFSDRVFSEARYGTGEHVLSGLVDAGRVTPSYEIPVNGVKFTYAELIATADFYDNYDQMAKAAATELTRLKSLIDRSKRYYEKRILGTGSGGSQPTDTDWQSATGGRYLKLAEDNFAHFAPPNSTYISSFSSSKPNHKSEWEKYHQRAIGVMRAGKDSTVVDGALAVNAFGDHFLTDAFSAGHLFNKDDLSEYFKSRVLSGGKVNTDGVKMFDNIAAKAFTGKLKEAFSKHETVERKGFGIFRPNIDSADIFSKLLQGIMEQQPDIIGKTMVAKLLHDALNSHSGGVPVTNKKGDTWNLTGDDSLNKANLEMMRKAVKQSIINLSDSVADKSPVSVFFAKVWDYTPRPTPASVTMIKNMVRSYTNPLGSEIVDGANSLLTANYQTLLDELVKRNVLKKA